MRVGEHDFKRIKSVGNRVKFHLFDDIDFIAELIGAGTSNVSGAGITEEVFDLLLGDDGLKDAVSLNVSEAPLGMNSLKKLIPLNNITNLEVDSKVLTLEDFKHFTSQRPDGSAIFNREEVL